MQLFALLPPLPFEWRVVLGLLGTVFAGILNLVFRQAAPRWWQFGAAILVAPFAILLVSALGVNSGQRTPYVFWGAVVGIVLIRGRRQRAPIPALRSRALIVAVTFAVLGPIVGLSFHFLRFLLGFVKLDDSWELGLCLLDGLEASFAGLGLAAVLFVGSIKSAGQLGNGQSEVNDQAIGKLAPDRQP